MDHTVEAIPGSLENLYGTCWQGSIGGPECSTAHQKSRDLAGEVGPVPTRCIQNCSTQLTIIPTYYVSDVYFFIFKCKTHKQDSFLTKLSSGNHSAHRYRELIILDLCSTSAKIPGSLENLYGTCWQGSIGGPECSTVHQKSRDLAGEVGPVPTRCIQNCSTQLMIIPTYYASHVYFFTLKCKTH